MPAKKKKEKWGRALVCEVIDPCGEGSRIASSVLAAIDVMKDWRWIFKIKKIRKKHDRVGIWTPAISRVRMDSLAFSSVSSILNVLQLRC